MKWIIVLVATMLAATSALADNQIGTGTKFSYTGDYRISSSSGNESLYDINFTKVKANYSVLLSNGSSVTKERTDTIICLLSDFDSKKLNEKSKSNYTVPNKIKLKKDSDDYNLDRKHIKKGESISSKFEKGDKYRFCYQANPLEDFYLKFGENSIVIEQETALSLDLYLVNVTGEPFYTHLQSNYTPLANHYSFDMDNATDSNDLSVYGYTMSTSGAVRNSSSGIIGDGYFFDGIDDTLTMLETEFELFSEFTLSAWIKPLNKSEFTPQMSIISNADTSTSAGYNFMINTDLNGFDSSLAIELSDGATPEQFSSSSGVILHDVWQHVLVTYDGLDVNLYHNGMSVGNGTTTVGFSSIGSVFVGSAGDFASYYNGSIDQVFVFNQTFTPEQALSLYRNETPIFNMSGLQHYKNFNQTLTNETKLNVSVRGYERLFGSNISVSVGEWNISDGYDDTDPDLVFSLHLDNNSALGENDTHFVDSSRYQNNGTGSGFDGDEITTGKHSKGVDFDGTNDMIDFDSPTELQLTGSMTLSAWVNPDADESFGLVSYDNVGGTRGYGLTPGTDGTSNKFRLSLGATGNTLIKRYSTTTVASAVGSWHHIVGVYDANAQTMDIYFDGILDNGVLQGAIPSSQQVSNGELRVGNFVGFDADFNGQLDDILIYNRTLSQVEIKELYIKGKLNYTYSPIQNLTTNISNTNDNVSTNNFSVSNTTEQFIIRFGLHSSSTHYYSPYLSNNNISLNFYDVGTEEGAPASDTTPPLWTEIPENRTIAFTDQNFSVDFNATDETAISQYFINDTNFFNITFDGNLTNSTSLGVGTYHVNVSVNDTSDNINSSHFSLTVNQFISNATLYLNSNNATDTVTYPSGINASGVSDIGSVSVFRNSTDMSSDNNLNISYAVGHYNFTVILGGNENYSTSRASHLGIVQSASGNVSLLLNALNGSLNLTYSDTVNVSGRSDTGTITLFRNGTDITNDNNLNRTVTVGHYNMTSISTGDENHSTVRVNRTVIMKLGSSVTNTLINGTDGEYSQIAGDVNLTGLMITQTNGQIEIYENGTLRGNTTDRVENVTSVMATGHYNITSIYQGNENYSSSQEEHTLILTSVGDSTPPLLTEVPQNISVEYLVQFFVDVNATDETSFDRFFINDTTRFNITFEGNITNVSTLAVGTYYVNISFNDSSNNVNTTSWRVTITRATGEVNLSLNLTDVDHTQAEGGFVNISGFAIIPNFNDIATYQNGTHNTSATNVIHTLFNFSAGHYNITVIGNQTENYTVSQEQHLLIITERSAAPASSGIPCNYFRVGNQTSRKHLFQIACDGEPAFDYNYLVINQSRTPASSSEACHQGTIAWDTDYIYVCTSTNSWKRSALTTW